MGGVIQTILKVLHFILEIAKSVIYAWLFIGVTTGLKIEDETLSIA